jgi:tetratricopeptide (TPR) repeat protein
MKKYNIIIAMSLVSILVRSQTLQEARTKTDNERFELAAIDFRSLISKEPSKGENYFYFGENYFKNDQPDSAEYYYAKGAEVNATNPLNYVGLGKVLLGKGKISEAKAQFFKATTLGGNKNAEVMRRISEAWLATENKNADEALAMANAAVKLEPKNPTGHIVLGDAQLEKNPTDGSAPVKSYQMATSLNPKSPQGIIREGKLYQRGRNYQLALEYYKKAIALDPNFAPAYREIAELYSLAGQPAKSIENWKKYLELNNSEYARYRFMSALFSNKQYPEAINEYESLKKSNFNNLYLERLAGYSYAEMGTKTDSMAFTKGLKAINKFFEMAGPNFKYIPNDYKYKGLLLFRTGQDSLGMKELDKAISLDSNIAGDIYTELGRAAAKSKKYDQAIIMFEKKRKGNNKNLNTNDFFDLGKSYYFSGQNLLKEVNEQKEALSKKKKPVNTPEITEKEALAMSMFSKADSSFKELTLLSPAWPLGYAWRGRANSITDPKAEKDSTRTYYEKVLQLVKPEEKTGIYKNYVIEANEYLGYYYVTKKDDARAREYWQAVKQLDPSNEKANSFLNPKKPQAPGKTQK